MLLLHTAAGGIITDLLSFYTLPSTVIGNEKYDTLTAAYMYYTVATETPLNKLMQDALILAKKSYVTLGHCCWCRPFLC